MSQNDPYTSNSSGWWVVYRLQWGHLWHGIKSDFRGNIASSYRLRSIVILMRFLVFLLKVLGSSPFEWCPFAGIFYLLWSTTSIGHFKAFRDILLKEWPRRLSRPYHFIKSNSIQIRLFDVACGSLWPGYASCLEWNVSQVTVCAEKEKNHHKSFLKSSSVILPDYSRFFRTEDANYSKGGIICFGSQSLAWLLKNVESIAET